MSDINIGPTSLQLLTLSPTTTILSLPVELIIIIVNQFEDDLLSAPPFASDPGKCVEAVTLHQHSMLNLSRFHRNWTPIAQSALFRNILLPDARSIELIWELVEQGPFEGYRHNVVSVIYFPPIRTDRGLGETFPNIKTISRNENYAGEKTGINFDDFGKSLSIEALLVRMLTTHTIS